MGINVLLTGYRGTSVVARVLDERGFLAKSLAIHDLGETICLRFIDHFGSTIFNGRQAPVLKAELDWLMSVEAAGESKEVLRRASVLAKHCAAQPHLFIAFEGD